MGIAHDESIINLIAEEAKRCGMKGKKGSSEPAVEDANEKMDPMFLDAVEVGGENISQLPQPFPIHTFQTFFFLNRKLAGQSGA